MSIKQLSGPEIKSMSLEEKDRWWFENCYHGDLPQLTIRSAVTGFVLGGILSLTNLYVGMKTGWTLGVGITSVILSFAIWKALSKFGVGNLTILENNAMQSCATSAGYVIMPLSTSLAAYMMVTGTAIPMFHTMTWMIAISALGVLFAFPMKRRFINDEQLPFPEGKACGIVLDGLHSKDQEEGSFKSRLLLAFSFLGALFSILRSEHVMTKIFKLPLFIPGFLDDFIYKFATPMIMGSPLKNLTVRLETDVVMFALGGLVGIQTGFSLLMGAILNYMVLAPIMIEIGAIHPSASGTIGFREITIWSLWGGVALMTSSSIFSFFAKPKVILDSVKNLWKKEASSPRVLKDIELPTWVFIWGIPLVGGVCVFLTYLYFDVHPLMGLVALPLTFFFTLIAVHATALTAITPNAALGKLTQLTFSVLSPGNIKTNLMTAGITSESSANAANLLSDIKPGYMLGAKPRHQAWAHVIGLFSGTLFATPVFYKIFGGDVTVFGSENLPMPAALVWKAVADVLTQGISYLHPTAKWAMVVGITLGIVLELLKPLTKNKMPISGVALGLAFILPFHTNLALFCGGFFFWLCTLLFKTDGKAKRILALNSETICAGIVAGGAIMGIGIILLELNG